MLELKKLYSFLAYIRSLLYLLKLIFRYFMFLLLIAVSFQLKAVSEPAGKHMSAPVITGKITDKATGKPIAGVTVKVYGFDDVVTGMGVPAAPAL